MEMQGWNSVAAVSTLLDRQRRSGTKPPIAETMPPRVAVLVTPSVGEAGAMKVDQGTGMLQVPSGPNGLSKSGAFSLTTWLSLPTRRVCLRSELLQWLKRSSTTSALVP